MRRARSLLPPVPECSCLNLSPLHCRGFKMLAAMGYQPGQGLGQAASGPREPVPLTLKQDRLGLGRPSQRALKRARREEAGAAQPAVAPVQLPDSSSFLRQAAARVAAGRAAAQLRRAQQVMAGWVSAWWTHLPVLITSLATDILLLRNLAPSLQSMPGREMPQPTEHTFLHRLVKILTPLLASAIATGSGRLELRQRAPMPLPWSGVPLCCWKRM